MTPKQESAMRQALEALELTKSYGNNFGYRRDERSPYPVICDALDSIRKALAEPVQVSVGDITAAMVMELREKTDAPMMECKKALLKTDGDMIKAEEILGVNLNNRYAAPPQRMPLDEPVQEPLESVWDTGLTNKEYEDAMRIKRLRWESLERANARLNEIIGKREEQEKRLGIAEPAQEPVACLIGTKGSAFDLPTTKRAYTYAEQPGNGVAFRLGLACDAAASQRAGDSIDRGLGLLQELQIKGFGVFDLGAEYDAPPQRKPLTDEEIYLATNQIDRNERGWAMKFARTIEAAHGIKE